MKADVPKPTPAETKFDQAREDAFSNEGAPPPADATGKAAAVARVCSLLSVKTPGRGR